MPVVNPRPDGSRNQDEAYKEFFLSRAPPKRRKSGGLDARLGRMLHHLNTSLIEDPSQLPGRRPRNPSSCSSSSTIVPETAQALIESIHKTVKSDNVGENFAVIKPCRSPNKTHTGFFTNNNLPSWKNSDNKSRKDQVALRLLCVGAVLTPLTLDPRASGLVVSYIRHLGCRPSSSLPRLIQRGRPGPL